MDFDPSLPIEEHPQVYRPAEDSFLLLRSIAVERGERFLEIGTGTGLIALHAARTARTIATDANPAAVRLARANAARNGLPMTVVRTDLAAGLRGPFDVVAFNPPYLEGRPRDDLDRAWQGGTGGSETSVRLLSDLERILTTSGRAYLLLSRANTNALRASRTYEARTLASEKLFFEQLDVLELTRRGP